LYPLSNNIYVRIPGALGLDLSRTEATSLLRGYDADRSGTLSLAEFATNNIYLHRLITLMYIGALGLDLSRTEATALLRGYDADRSGTLSLAEFATLARKLGFSPPPPPAPRGRHHPAVVHKFEEFDTNRTGALSLRELRAMLSSLGIDLRRKQAYIYTHAHTRVNLTP